MTLKLLILLPLVAITMALSGCGSSSSMTQPLAPATAMGAQPPLYYAGDFSAGTTEIPAHILNAIKGHLDAELQKNGIAGAADYTNRLRIDGTVTYYRMRSGFTRAMFGVFAGKDGVTCAVKLVDGRGATVGGLTVESYNMLAIGSEDDVARMVATETVKALKGVKK